MKCSLTKLSKKWSESVRWYDSREWKLIKQYAGTSITFGENIGTPDTITKKNYVYKVFGWKIKKIIKVDIKKKKDARLLYSKKYV